MFRLATAIAMGLVLAIPARAQLMPGDVVLAVGRYPNFDAGTSSGAIRVFRDGSISDPLDSYETWSQGPHDVVNDIQFVDRRLVFDRAEGLGFIDGEDFAEWSLSLKISSFVQDRSGSIYIAYRYGPPALEKLTASGETEWVATLPELPHGDWLAMDLARDQCTLWYSAAYALGVYRLDVCRDTGVSMIYPLPAREIRLLADGTALVAIPTGIAHVDVAGNVIREVGYRLPETANAQFVSISIDADLAGFWVAEGTRFGNSVLYSRRLDDFELTSEFEIPGQLGAATAVVVIPEWRAAQAPPVRRRGVRPHSNASTAFDGKLLAP